MAERVVAAIEERLELVIDAAQSGSVGVEKRDLSHIP
jgi:hypothetical protein